MYRKRFNFANQLYPKETKTKTEKKKKKHFCFFLFPEQNMSLRKSHVTLKDLETSHEEYRFKCDRLFERKRSGFRNDLSKSGRTDGWREMCAHEIESACVAHAESGFIITQ